MNYLLAIYVISAFLILLLAAHYEKEIEDTILKKMTTKDHIPNIVLVKRIIYISTIIFAIAPILNTTLLLHLLIKTNRT